MEEVKKHPTKAQWAELEAQSRNLFGSIRLRCDGYLVLAKWEREGKTGQRFVLRPYVNGYWRGKWHKQVTDPADLPEESRRFWRLTKSRACTPAKIIQLEKSLGKRICQSLNIYAVKYMPTPSFQTVGSFIRHIKKHNQSIEILTDDEYRAAIDALPPEEDV